MVFHAVSLAELTAYTTDCNLALPEQEEIIELQDIRLSPIPSIRNRFGGSRTLAGRPGSTHALGGNGADAGGEPQSFPPSFRIQRAPTYGTSRRTKDRGTSAGGGGGGRGKLIHQVLGLSVVYIRTTCAH